MAARPRAIEALLGGRVVGESTANEFADASMEALADVTPSADELPYFTSPSAAALAPITSFARSLLATSDTEEATALLGYRTRTLESFDANVGTGDATVDTAALQAAIVWLNAAARRILLLGGATYNINAVLNPITQSDVSIVGYGPGATLIRIPTGVTTVGKLWDVRGARVYIGGFFAQLQESTAPATGYLFTLDGASDCVFDNFRTQGFAGLSKVGETTTCQRNVFDKVQGTWNADLGQPPILHYRAINIRYRGAINGLGSRHVVPRGYIEILSPAAGPGFPGQDTSDFDITIQYIPQSGVTTNIAAGSNGQTLPQATINVDDTTGFAASGTLRIGTSGGSQTITYTGKTGTTFTGCTGGTTLMRTGDLVTYVETRPEGYWYGVLVRQSSSGSTVNQWFGRSTIDHWTAAGLAYFISGTKHVRHHHYTDIRTTGETNRSGGTGVLVCHNSTSQLQSVSVDGVVNFAGSRAAVISGGNEVQSVLVRGDGGTYTLTFSGQTTGALAVDATAATIQTALEGLSNIGTGNVKVIGGPSGPVDLTTNPPTYWPSPFFVIFCGTLANTDVAQITAATGSLTSSAGAAGIDIATEVAGTTTDNIKSFRLRAQLEDIAASDQPTRPAAVTLAAENCLIESPLDFIGSAGKSVAFMEVAKDIQAMVVRPAPRAYTGASEIVHYPYATTSAKRIALPEDLSLGVPTVILRLSASLFGATANTYLLSGNNTLPSTNSANLVQYLDPALFALPGKRTQYSLEVQLSTNLVAPGINFTVGLYPVTAVAGGANTVSITLGTVVSGSTVAFNTPAATSQNHGSSGVFTAPAAGFYTLGVVVSGTQAASSAVGMDARLLSTHA